MKKILLPLLALPLLCLVFAGCEWSASNGSDSTGGASTWNDRENFVDFSGSYRSSDGNVLVRQFGVTATSTNTVTSTNTIAGEILGTGDGSLTAFSGRLANNPPIPGSLTIVCGGYRFADPGTASAGTVTLTASPADGSSGTLNLDTGVWTLSFPAPLASGTQILGSYKYRSSSSTVTPIQGNHGTAIYSFTLYQQGNTIEAIDSNGTHYSGYIGSVRTTGGVPIDLNPTAQNPNPTTGPIVAQLYLTGTSQGFKVQITGVLQGTLTSASTLANRTMQATYSEEGGYDADIKAVAQ